MDPMPFELTPADPEGYYASSEITIARNALEKSILDLCNLAKNEIDRLYIPGPIVEELNLGITKIVFTLTDITVTTFDFNGNIDLHYPLTKDELLTFDLKDVNVEIILNYKAAFTIPNTTLEGQISIKILLDLYAALDFYITDVSTLCPYKPQFSDRTAPKIKFKQISIDIGGSAILNAFAIFISNLLQDTLDDLLTDLIKELLVTKVNEHIYTQGNSSALNFKSFPDLKDSGISFDRRYVDLKWETENVSIEQGGYLFNNNNINSSFIPDAKKVQLPTKYTTFNDMSYIFGIDSLQSAFYEFSSFKKYNYIVSYDTIIQTNLQINASNIDKDLLFNLDEKSFLHQVFPDLIDPINKAEIIFETKNLKVAQIGPGGPLINFDYLFTIKNKGTGETILKGEVNSNLVTPMNIDLMDYEERNQTYQVGFFWFLFKNYKIPEKISIIENPMNLNVESNQIEKLKIYSYALQNMINNLMSNDSHNGLCIQIKNIIFSGNRYEEGFVYNKGYAVYWYNIN